MKQVTSQTAAVASIRVHIRSTARLHPEDAVLASRVAGDHNTALTGVDTGGAPTRSIYRAAPDVFVGLSRLLVDVRGSRSTSVAFLGVGGSA